MRVGQNRRRDANERAIVAGLEAVGAVVFRLSAPGCPDLLVGWQGRWLPMEVKTRKGTLTPLQAGLSCPVVHSVDEALQALGVTR